MSLSARWVVKCCYLGMFVQALVVNLTPLLFIPLREQFGLSFEQIGRLVLVNFATQLVVDLVCTALADRMALRPLIAAANALAAVGLWVFAFAGTLFGDVYTGLLVGTVIFSTGCGLLEVLLSPIVNALPSANKSASMALLHAFYPIGKVVVILLTGAAFVVVGVGAWPWIVVAWTVLPVVNAVAFGLVDLPRLVDPERRQTLRSMLRGRAIYVLLVAMVLAGATELTLAQWTSAYVQTALGYSKTVADLVGFLLFGVGMIVGRVWFGLRGEHGNLVRVMAVSAGLSAAACLVMALSPSMLVALLATGCAGFFVSMLWPGTVSLAAARFPLAGASLFALLAAAGDGGAAVMPWLVGVVADGVRAGQLAWAEAWGLGGVDPQALGLRLAYVVTALWPLLMVVVVLVIGRAARGGR